VASQKVERVWLHCDVLADAEVSIYLDNVPHQYGDLLCQMLLFLAVNGLSICCMQEHAGD